MKVVFCVAVLIFFASSSYAYNDDSYDDTALWESVKGICPGGRVVKDTKYIRFSCAKDEVRLDPKSKRLYKNDIQLDGDDIRDFKVSRNGKVFYRDRNGYLYDERGRLNIQGSRVILYLVSTGGDLVYLNQRGDLFKNGRRLTGNVTIHKTFKAVRFLNERRFRTERFFAINPAISRNGKAVYIESPKLGSRPAGGLFVDGIQISPGNVLVTDFKLTARGEVYYRDTKRRLYLNGKQISDGRSAIAKSDDYKLNNRGRLAYLNERKELIFNGKVQPTGDRRVVSFHFNSKGDLLYKDSKGRRWKNGRLINN